MTSTIYSREPHHNSVTVVITAARLARCIGARAIAPMHRVRKSPIERPHRAQPRIAKIEDPRYREDAILSLARVSPIIAAIIDASPRVLLRCGKLHCNISAAVADFGLLITVTMWSSSPRANCTCMPSECYRRIDC